MPPVRVMADPPVSSKRSLEPEEPVHARVTRHKSKMTAATNQHEIPLLKDRESSLQTEDGFQSMDEGSTVHMAEGSTVAPTVDRNDVFCEDQEHPIVLRDQGKLIPSLLSSHFTNTCMYVCLGDPFLHL